MKKIILWNYERASWQWDVLCLLIVAFIFLTPKTWFERKERLATQTSRLVVKAQDFPISERSEMERRVKEISGNDNAEIVTWREKKTPQGEVFYEIEIR